MDRDEVEALSAIYGDLAEVRADGSVAVAVQSSDESREALLLLTASSLYPASAPHLAVEGRRGVKNETLLAIRTELENEAKVCFVFCFCFCFCFFFIFLVFCGLSHVHAGAAGNADGVCSCRKTEAAAGHGRSGLCCVCVCSGARAQRRRKAKKPPGGRASHHAGHAMHRKRVYGMERGNARARKRVFCSIDDKNLFLFSFFLFRVQKWLEKRAAQIAERQKRQEAEADGKLTGKQMFLAARDDDKAARALLSQLIADENVDESLFAGE